MSCVSSNFSSFFLNSLNDSSEFAKYLSNGEFKFSSFEDFQAFGTGAGTSTSPAPPSPSAAAAAAATSSATTLTAQQAATQQQQQQQYYNGGNSNVNINAGANTTGLPSSIEHQYNNSVTPMNVVGNCGAEAINTSALTPANANNTTQPGVQQLQHGAHLHANTHHTPHPTHLPHAHPHPHAQHPYAGHAPHTPGSLAATTNAFHHTNHHASPHLAQGMSTAVATPGYSTTPQRWGATAMVSATPGTPHPITQLQNSNQPGTPIAPNPSGAQHFDGSFEFLKYLRHSNDYNQNGEPQTDAAGSSVPSTGQAPASTSSSSSLIDLDSSTSHKSRSSRKAAALLSSVSRTSNSLDANALDVFDHDSKHTIFDMHHMTATNSSNSNESSLEVSNLAFPSSHLNASNSNTSSEGAATGSSDFAMLQSGSAASSPKPLATFTIKDNFDVHPSHKVEEGIFQHMNKLPAKKKENLKQLGVRFTGQMTLSDKSIVVDNFIKFCQEYDVQDHRPFLSLNQSGLNKADQIKFARYLGQGLPTFTLFCIYSNFKNLFCTKRTEIYTKDGYNLPYILDKTKRFLSNTTAGTTPSKSNTSSSHSQSQSHSLPQSQPQSQQQQQQPTPQSQQQSTRQSQQQQSTPQSQPPPQIQQQQPPPQSQQQQPPHLQQHQLQTQSLQPLQTAQPLQLKPLPAHPMQAYPLQALSLQSQQLQPQSPQLQSLAAAHQMRAHSPHAAPMQPRPLQSTHTLQPHPLQQQQQQPLQPHPFQVQPLQPHPLQTQPLQPQPPKTLQTQTHPQLLLQTSASPLPPGHLQQLQQQQQHSPLHMPMSISRDLKNMVHQQSSDGIDFGPNTVGALDGVSGIARVGSSFDALPARCLMPKVLENLMIYENFDVHETHRVEDGVCTHITRLPPKKQEIFKQFGIQSNQTVTFYEKYIIVENFSKFCNEYKISDHRPFLDFHESGLPKCEQVKFVRYLGQGLPNLTLNKIYLSFKDLLGMNRIEKTTADGYNLEMILKKKKKNLYNRMQAAVHRESSESAPQTLPNAQPTTAQPTPLEGFKT